MTDFTHDLLIRGIAAVKANEHEEARYCFERLLDLDAPDEEKMEAWYWLAELSGDEKLKRNYLEEILARNLGDVRARRALSVLNGEIREEQTIDPDRYKPTRRVIRGEVDSTRFTCPNCGGRMTYTPDGNSLTCEYCDMREKFEKTGAESKTENADNFIAALLTAKGHTRPVSTRSITCGGCGRKFVLTAELSTFECPYCKALYAVDQADLEDLIEPQSIIPFKTTKEQALELLNKRLGQNAGGNMRMADSLTGVYIPVWLFNIGGVARWTYQVAEESKRISLFRSTSQRDETYTDSSVILYENLLVSAVDSKTSLYNEVIYDFDLDELVQYDSRYLSNWTGQAYQVSLGDASLAARLQALEGEKKRIQHQVPMNAENLVVHSSGIVVESYRLIVVSIWLVYSRENQPQVEFIINGQSGKVFNAY